MTTRFAEASQVHYLKAPGGARRQLTFYADNARRNQAPVWYLMAKDEGHGFQKKRNRDFQFYSSVLFMQQYLLN